MSTEHDTRPPTRLTGAAGWWIPFGLWTVLMLAILIQQSDAYDACQAQPTYFKICVDYSPAILVLWLLIGVPLFILAITQSNAASAQVADRVIRVRVLPDQSITIDGVDYPAGTVLELANDERVAQLLANGTVEQVD